MNPPAQPAPRPSFRNRGEVASPRNGARGITLIELLVVLTILAALAGMVTISISRGITIVGTDGRDRTPEEIVTLATMQAVRDALIGTSASDPGYRGDLGALPSRLGGLIENIDGEPEPFDPATRRGWRGPYLFDAGTRYKPPYVEADKSDNFPDNSDIPGIEGSPVILDGWGKPILLLGHDTDYARLVSAGPPPAPRESPKLDSPLVMPIPPSSFQRGNDLVLFLFTHDPNPPDPE